MGKRAKVLMTIGKQLSAAWGYGGKKKKSVWPENPRAKNVKWIPNEVACCGIENIKPYSILFGAKRE